MTLVRHFKNKLYRVRGVARHSETLEDFVIYEPRYPGSIAAAWIRPRAMFEESVKVDGVTRPRFECLHLRIDTFDAITPAAEAYLRSLIADTLGEWDPAWFHGRLGKQTCIHLQIGFLADEAVAFKLGYRVDERAFYSWLGGVRERYRGAGIASELMTAQHAWARAQGYRVIRTSSQNRWRAQMILNLRHGFDVVGVKGSDEGGMKILFEKALDPGSPDSTALTASEFSKHSRRS